MFSKSVVKYIQSLQHKKFRDEHGTFIAEGPKVVMELIESKKFECKNIYAIADWLETSVEKLTPNIRSKITEVKDFELDKLSHLTTPNLVLAEFQKKHVVDQPNVKGKITLLLDDIRDPGNLGTIIRTAHWFGIQHIICSIGCADMYNPKVVQSSMASLGIPDIIYTELATFMNMHKNIPSFAAVLDGTPLGSLKKIKEGFLIIGNESQGVSSQLLNAVSETITIPRTGTAESLNASVATGIMLYAMVNG